MRPRRPRAVLAAAARSKRPYVELPRPAQPRRAAEGRAIARPQPGAADAGAPFFPAVIRSPPHPQRHADRGAQIEMNLAGVRDSAAGAEIHARIRHRLGEFSASIFGLPLGPPEAYGGEFCDLPDRTKCWPELLTSRLSRGEEIGGTRAAGSPCARRARRAESRSNRAHRRGLLVGGKRRWRRAGGALAGRLRKERMRSRGCRRRSSRAGAC